MGDVKANYIVVKYCNVILSKSALNMSHVNNLFAFFILGLEDCQVSEV